MSETSDTMITLGSNTLHVLGTAFSSIGFLYCIKRVTTGATSLLENIPYLLGIKKVSREDVDENAEPLMNRVYYKVYDNSVYAVKLSLLIAMGTLCKYVARKMNSDDFKNIISHVANGTPKILPG